MRLRKLWFGPFAGYWTRDNRHWLIQLVASIFSWRPRWWRQRQYEKARREALLGAQAVIDSAVGSFRASLDFLESLPPPPPRTEFRIAPPFKRARKQWLLEQKRGQGR